MIIAYILAIWIGLALLMAPFVGGYLARSADHQFVELPPLPSGSMKESE